VAADFLAAVVGALDFAEAVEVLAFVEEALAVVVVAFLAAVAVLVEVVAFLAATFVAVLVTGCMTGRPDGGRDDDGIIVTDGAGAVKVVAGRPKAVEVEAGAVEVVAGCAGGGGAGGVDLQPTTSTSAQTASNISGVRIGDSSPWYSTDREREKTSRTVVIGRSLGENLEIPKEVFPLTRGGLVRRPLHYMMSQELALAARGRYHSTRLLRRSNR
jgi:hypothetical protein